ncbi:MAG TPA: polysaccharide biosynthesis tyrosine autokinase [Verrucomicrobiae bacterium]|nr:polysaccharide biosynthesis tyrosine autokinase [Verrucomicrobiae bacterium]
MFDDDYQQPEETGLSSFDWRNVFYILLEHSKLIALCLIVSTGLAVVYLSRAPVIYAASAVLKFETGKPKILDIEGVVADDYDSEDAVNEKVNEIGQLLKNRTILARVIATNNLATDPRFVDRPVRNPTALAALAGRLSGMVHVQLRKGTHLIDITVEHTDPRLTAQLANSFVDELLRQNAESYKTASQLAATFLAEEAQQLQHKLNDAEAKLQTYKDQSLSLEQQQAIVAENLKSVNEKVESAKAERVRLETEYRSVKDTGDDVSKLLELPEIAADPSVSAARAGIAHQTVEFANIKQVFLPKHPTYIQAQGKLDELEQVLSNAALRAAQMARATYENARSHELALTKELDKQEAEAQQLNKQFVPYNVLLRDIEQYRALYDSVVKRMGETTIAGNLDTQRIQVFQTAEVPKTPIKPNKVRVLALGLMAGLGCGLMLALGRGMFDDSLKTLTEAEQVLKMPVLSTIPQIPTVETGEKRVVVDDEGPTSGAESFRFLRTSLSLQNPEKPLRTALFTSSMPGEGKTFCAVNYAVSLAQQGLSTVLIDCDLRRPMVDEFFWGEKSDHWGVTQFLNRKQKFDDIVQATTVENLWLVTAGPYSSNASELLAKYPFNLLLEEALRRFDRVVVDSAPVFGVSDTLLLVGHTDVVCLVVRARRTSKATVRRAAQVLERAGAPASGVILNAVPRTRRAAYGDPYYDYGYYPKRERASAEKA